ncbi:hypothetical protein [Segniliparus rugosus]|uniref:Uncharacterized protein n=1 Tax=Segniliparus rugosus (strain ATCC BAA-974 / DSM 45345 / CCUG 50838 / CIP 108380 / JCM 13579 / CDC 945) TaxID=679197 RepID=E5XLN8_SEGRC|nr:hypothetical protein [Segniliparus rugosus]EFV14716.1 hypothetical protein HMPREF9336_00407 [Segniliparus rugosus ATCC BAA-974]
MTNTSNPVEVLNAHLAELASAKSLYGEAADALAEATAESDKTVAQADARGKAEVAEAKVRAAALIDAAKKSAAAELSAAKTNRAEHLNPRIGEVNGLGGEYAAAIQAAVSTGWSTPAALRGLGFDAPKPIKPVPVPGSDAENHDQERAA